MCELDNSDPENNKLRFDTPCFTANDVTSKFHKLLFEDSFQLNVNKLKVTARSAGGREKSVQVIENAYIHYQAASPVDGYDD